jgi:hypothetical protein
LHYVGRELTPALRHRDEAQHVEELRPAEEACLALIGVHPDLHDAPATIRSFEFAARKI